ncbi:hypothetical protein [Marinobacter subterrani]|uniref:hypothetical protein n=1 Tax=Marinobacter subterrani TaxID=1658765 RepID=UPI002355646E|nr:hypothetical protein [Marinobacter subterrani]
MTNFTPKYKQSQRALWRIRSKIFSYPEHLEAKASRVLEYLKERHLRDRRAERLAAPVGPYSGLNRRELAATGTCETDWF